MAVRADALVAAPGRASRRRREALAGIGLIAVAPLLSGQLDQAEDTAIMNGTAVVLDADLPLTSKIPIALDIYREFQKVPDGELPDCAAVIGAIEGCTGRRVEEVVGKPSPRMFEAALERLGLLAADCLVVGDRLETDVLMGRRAGSRTAFVLTGVSRRGDLQAHPDLQPDYVLHSIRDLPALLSRDQGTWTGPMRE